MIESLQFALAKTCLWSAALLLSALAGWKAFKSLAWILPLIERKSFRLVVFGAAVCLGGLCVCISYGGSKTNSPPASAPRLLNRQVVAEFSPMPEVVLEPVTMEDLVAVRLLSNDFQIASYRHSVSQDVIRLAWTNVALAFPAGPGIGHRVEVAFAKDLASGDWSYLHSERISGATFGVNFSFPTNALPSESENSGFFAFAPYFDSDDDGLSDLEELILYRTSPWNVDSDDDGFTDSEEVVYGWNPTDPADGFLATGRSPEWYILNYPGVFALTTNADESVSVAFADPDESCLYYPVELSCVNPGLSCELSIDAESGAHPSVSSLLLPSGVTNVVPLRIGRRYVFDSYGGGRFDVRSDDPFVRVTTNYDRSIDVCRPVKVVLTDRPPPEDATRCPVGHVHARYCDFATDPALTGELAFYDTKCISVDNSNRTLSVATSWAPGHRSANRIMEDYGALGTFTETNGTVDLVFDDLCPHSVGSAAYCLCGQSFYCPDCIGSTAAWYNMMFPDLLTATNAPDGSVSLSWHEGVASNAYYFIELTPTDRNRRFTITPRLPTMTRDYVVQASSGMKARIPLLIGVPYTVSIDYGGFTVTPETGDVVVTRDSPRSFTVERPLKFGAMRNVALELRCPSGHVHTRRYRVVTNIPDIPGTVEIDETKCIAAADGDGFAVTCDGIRGDGCATEDVVTGRFIYEGVTKPFAITNSALCRCDNLHHPTCPCGAASLCDECDTTIYGQGADWVRANFDRLRGLDPNLDDADDILRYG